ncbi:hypothetical protein AFCDBAGC_0174 [Methylobacterium cerastii]|uniref:Uncharacterized protein n=2 Tax=Methylobacterium TaxID=407 RepID=A0ABQ4U5Z1_9HYPH|nr:MULTISPECIES: hypothetical protein [Methylobacterium]TXM79403.1 hypothetical protein FV218_00490 [Methylobacterium sp. WL69]TXN20285.1 hypothetical protein FV220_24225 [Methylobacterium sp. WL19]GJD42338.1 hypothetical protein AFCDBAGC_0174 [Methylobacterium cerastii]GJE62211.1 hypothetical protein MPOCJGCO_4341 [Methylobacterium trifolii]
MTSDIERHQQLLSSLKQAQGKGDGSFEQAVTDAFEHVFEHLGRLNAISDPDAEDRPLKPGETATLR